MRVLHTISDTDRRGSQVFARDLSEAMNTLGHESQVIALTRGNESPGIDVPVLEGGSSSSLTKALRSAMRECDLTVAHGPKAGLACVRSMTRSTPFVYRQVRDTRFWQRRPPRPTKVPPYIKKAAKVFALSSGARNDLLDLLELSGAQVAVAPFGIATRNLRAPTPSERLAARQQLGFDDATFVAVTVGRLSAEKAIDIAIRASIKLEEVQLVVVGDGPERERLERLVDGLAPGRVTFTGPLPDVMPAYAAADVLVHPSVTGDSLPRVLLEAAMCGIPAVTTPIGSIEEIVVHGATGLVVPPNDVQGLSLAIEVMHSGRVGRELMGEAARERALQLFELDVVAKEWLELLTDVGVPAR